MEKEIANLQRPSPPKQEKEDMTDVIVYDSLVLEVEDEASTVDNNKANGWVITSYYK